jgi:translation initiation factor IF-2
LGKHLKLNIKNLQLAGALKPKVQPPEEKASTQKQEPAKKRKTRIVQAPSSPAEASQLEEMQAPLPTFTPSKETSSSPQENVEQAAPSSISKVEEPGDKVQKDVSSKTEGKTTPSLKQPQVDVAVKPHETHAHPLPPKREPPKDLRVKKKEETRSFDSRDRQGLRDIDNEAWRKRKVYKPKYQQREEIIIRPKSLSVRIPITIKDLAQEMKLKASQLIAKLLMQGMTYTLNDYLTDETVIQLLGHDFDCAIRIDTTEEKRIRITDQTIKQEIESIQPEDLMIRPPVVAFMGHVDHGKTSLIDAIRKSNRVAGEAGAITQHIGAFQVKTKAGNVTILDTPGHEAFSEMRSRGANVTDIVILVIAGDEGIKMQTEEAIRQAREASVPILVALNKCDKPNFDPQKVYRELSERELLPEAWGGSTIAVNCSATTGQGIQELLEMIALQAEILELRASLSARARGTILESEMHKGLGAVATVLVQNGTLRMGDAIVFGHFSGRVKTMQDEHGISVEEAGPSSPVKITGLSELAIAGSEFIVVKNEKEAKELAEARAEGQIREESMRSKVSSLEKMMAKKESGELKILPLILRADVQGSLEALKNSLMKVHSKKVRLEIVSADVGEISESDIELAAASKSTIVGFHTSIESHAEALIKQKHIPVYTHDVIYHLIDEVRLRMKSLLDKLAQETDTGALIVKAVFKSSQLGNIAGCQVTDGLVKRQHHIRQIRGKEMIWKGKMASLKRVKEDVKEVKEGLECGVVLDGQNDVKEGDILQAYEITWLEQDL